MTEITPKDALGQSSTGSSSSSRATEADPTGSGNTSDNKTASQLLIAEIKLFSLKNWRLLFTAFFLIVAEVFVFIGLTCVDFTIKVEHGWSLIIGLILAWNIFIFNPRFRLFLAITGMVAFNTWLVLKGINSLPNISVINKETAFIIAIAILAWLAMSCFVLSLLKDNQSESD